MRSFRHIRVVAVLLTGLLIGIVGIGLWPHYVSRQIPPDSNPAGTAGGVAAAVAGTIVVRRQLAPLRALVEKAVAAAAKRAGEGRPAAWRHHEARARMR
mgnify:CR=1 FL=1